MGFDPTRPPLPIFVQPPSSIKVSGLRVLLDKSGWPRTALVEGPMDDDNGRLALFIAAEFEGPQELPKTKQGIEWVHLAKARGDLERVGNRDLSGTTKFGSDPPDVVVGDHEPINVELAQFTQSSRRQVLALLNAVKNALIHAPSEQFQHLKGRLVMIGFEDPAGLPPRAFDSRAIDSVLQMLKTIAPGPEACAVAQATAADGFSVKLTNSVLGSGTAACFPLPVLPASALAERCGFDIAASLTVVVRAKDTEQQLARIVFDHDEPKNDVLVISAGAPGRPDGFALAGDEIAVEPWIMRTVTLPQPRHLKRVLLHRWSHGDVYELFPKYRELAPSTVTGGGPLIVPVGVAPEWVWMSPCPCGAGNPFHACHGQRRE